MPQHRERGSQAESRGGARPTDGDCQEEEGVPREGGGGQGRNLDLQGISAPRPPLSPGNEKQGLGAWSWSGRRGPD